MMNIPLIAAGLLAIPLAAGAVSAKAQAELPSWRGKAMSAFVRGSHHIEKVKLADGAIFGESVGVDPFWTVGHKPFKPTPTQEVVFRAKSPVGGRAEFYWTPLDAPRPTAATGRSFEWIGDGRWHEYRVRPFWHGGADIKSVRIDFPNGAKGEVALADVRIVDELKPELKPIGDSVGVTFVCTSATRDRGVFSWVSDVATGIQKETFVLAADGRPHRYHLTLAGRPGWRGNLVWSRFTRGNSPDALEVSDFRVVTDDVEVAPDLVVCGVNWATPACRAGTDGRIEAVVKNLGSEPAGAVALRVVSAPEGLSCRPEAAKAVNGGFAEMMAVTVRAAGPLEGTVRLEIVQDGKPVATKEISVKILPSLGLPKADGVPEPRPPKCDYEIGALYYPGWERAEAWKRVWQTCPERRPYLGWYDETKSEVVDWQIKWLRENGIGALYVDWYWNKGYRHHEHWIAAFRRAKWRSYLKWAIMWANHTPAGAHSVEDQRAATQFWIDNYFNMPEYLTHDGKPVVWIWQARNLDRDLGPGGCRKLLDLSRDMAVKAGYKGIHFIAMKWPEDNCDASVMESYRTQGFDEVGIYHFMEHGGKANGLRRIPYSLVADANPDHWRRQWAAKSLPFLPNLSTGWDDRPWNDQFEIFGKNAADFRRICREAKKFADETGIRRLCISPVNEWGEGSYAEPNAEHGFGFYEAVRETFCEKPAEGWPQNMVPADVGLGPYDLPLPRQPQKTTSWDFTDGQTHGWKAFMGTTGERNTSEGLAFETDTRDPAMCVSHSFLRTRDYKTVTVRLRLENAKGRVVVFWARSRGEMTGEACVALPVVSDGKFHDYVFPVSNHRRWRGYVGALRLDPCENPGARVTVAGVRLD